MDATIVKPSNVSASCMAQVEEIQEALAEGRVFLDTHVGRRKVVSFHDHMRFAVTNNAGTIYDRRSFGVSLENVTIEARAYFEEDV